jgi:hypothetical protein
MNPFKLPDIEHIGHSSPLNPSTHNHHADYYASVDNTLKSFEAYVNMVNAFNGVPKRHAILVHGESGCGKSSLIYRCINFIKSNTWQDNQTKLYVLDFRGENFAALSASDKVDHLINLIALQLQDKVITENLAENFETKIQQAKDLALPYLEIELRKNHTIPVMFFPAIETDQEISEYLSNFYRSNWFLFFETTNPTVVTRCETNYSMASIRPVQLLRVNPLQAIDAANFLGTRMALLQDSPSAVIKFEENALEEYLHVVATGPRGGASLRELEIICSKAFDKAVESQKTTITFKDMAHVAIASLQPGV